MKLMSRSALAPALALDWRSTLLALKPDLAMADMPSGGGGVVVEVMWW